MATLAHELRNPLAPIRTGLEVMKHSRGDAVVTEKVRQTMERQTQQMIRLIDDLLDVSRITRGRLELRKRRVALSEILDSALEATRPAIDRGGHTLTVDLPSPELFLEADPFRMAQVVSNLLSNAAKYTPEGGRIWLKGERSSELAIVRVRDTGLGIPPDQLDTIFQMFSQIDRSTEREYTGLGIGLTLVRSLVELHGGVVEAHSEGAARGSEFVVEVPLHAGSTLQESEQAPQGRVEASPKRRVLVVDDNVDAVEMLGEMLRMLGDEVQTAHGGYAVLEMGAEFLPQVTFLDLRMPQLDGCETARRIRSEQRGRDVTLVALTGWGQDRDWQLTKQAGFDHHLVKPVEPSAMLQLLEGAPSEPH